MEGPVDYGEVGGAPRVADLRDMARGPMAIFERFMGDRMQGEVRWCKPDGRTPGRFLAGVRLISRAGDEWITLVGRLSESGQDARAPLESRGI